MRARFASISLRIQAESAGWQPAEVSSLSNGLGHKLFVGNLPADLSEDELRLVRLPQQFLF